MATQNTRNEATHEIGRLFKEAVLFDSPAEIGLVAVAVVYMIQLTVLFSCLIYGG